LVDQAREGDEDAFEQIVRRYSPRVFQIVSRFFRGSNQVEDVAQEVFLKAYTQLSSYEGRGSFEGWLARVATNTCLNELRTRKRHPESLVSELTEDEGSWLDSRLAATSTERTPEQSLIAADLAEKVLARLSPDDRLVVTLMDGEELSVKEVAEVTGWSQSKIKVQAFRARRRLRKILEQFSQKRGH
jgi:RNA polymerase sigma-70 factor (ECF subfamily)